MQYLSQRLSPASGSFGVLVFEHDAHDIDFLNVYHIVLAVFVA